MTEQHKYMYTIDVITVESNYWHVWVKKVSACESEYFSRAIHTEHEPSLDKSMTYVSKTNLASPKKFAHESKI